MAQRLTRMDEVLARVIEALANDRDNGDTILFMFGDHGMTDRLPSLDTLLPLWLVPPMTITPLTLIPSG